MELQTRKVTIYRKSEFGMGYVKVECRKFGFEHRKYAQYNNAVAVAFVEKGKRKVRGFHETTYPSCVVLEGHGHPDPDDPMTAPEVSETGCVVRRSRFSSFDPAWSEEFNAKLAGYLAESGATVVLDTRENDPYRAQNAA